MTSTGPNFDFDGPLKIELHAAPLAQAQAAYDAHMARRIEYDPRQACNSPHNEAWRHWAREKLHLEQTLTLAKALQGSTVVTFAPKPRAKAQVERTVHRLTTWDIVQRLESIIAQMAPLDIWSKEWDKLRCRASHLHHTAKERAKEEGSTIPIPDVPRDRRKLAHLKWVHEHIAAMEGLIAQMNALGPAHADWKRLQYLASGHRQRATRAIRDHKLDLRLPKIPHAWDLKRTA